MDNFVNVPVTFLYFGKGNMILQDLTPACFFKCGLYLPFRRYRKEKLLSITCRYPHMPVYCWPGRVQIRRGELRRVAAPVKAYARAQHCTPAGRL